MTDDDVPLLARAAAQLAALAQPDVAAVLAALPRRPGTTASLTEIGEASGLEMRTLGKAVARGRDVGVLHVDGDRVRLDTDGPRAVVEALVALTPLGAALADHPELRAAAPFGLIHGMPTGEHADRVLAVVVGLLPDGELTEPDITARLARLGDDPAGLRRALVDAELVLRTPDGAAYRRADTP